MTDIASQISSQRKVGYSDKLIALNLAQDPQVGGQVQAMLKNNVNPSAIVTKFATPPSLGATALRYSIGSGVANLLDTIPNAAVNVANLGIAAYGVGKHVLTGSNDLPDPIAADKLAGFSKLAHATGLIDEDYAPTTVAGRAMDAGIQGGIAALANPSAGARTVAQYALPSMRQVATSALSSSAGSLARDASTHIDTGSPLANSIIQNTAATAAGAAMNKLPTAKLPFTNGQVGSIPVTQIPAAMNATKVLNQYTPAQIAAASAAAKKSAAGRNTVSAYEALQDQSPVPNPNPRLQQQQYAIEQSNGGNNQLAKMVANRAQNVQNQFDSAIGQPAAPNADAATVTVTSQMRDAAQKALDARTSSGILDANGQPVAAKNAAPTSLADPLSGIANAKTMQEMQDALLPRDPGDIGPDQIHQALSQIDAQSPGLSRQFVNQFLNREMEAAKQQAPGPQVGAVFTQNVAGTPQQRNNVLQAVETSGGDTNALANLFDTTHAQGYRQSTGQVAAGPSLTNLATSVIAQPASAIPSATQMINGYLSNKYLAQALGSGANTVDDLVNLSQGNLSPPPTPRAMLLDALGSASERQAHLNDPTPIDEDQPE